MGKRRWGDRRDGRVIRDIDPLHYFMPLLYPNRCDNEGYMRVNVNIEKTEAYIRKWNSEHEGDRLTIFEVIIAAMLKTLRLRPQMNRFIANKRIYQRNEITAAFTVKKEFKDDGAEGLARIVAENRDTLATIKKKVQEQILMCRTGTDESSEAMKKIQKLPISRPFVAVSRLLDRHGWMPQSLIGTDPYQCSVVLSNLGSIGMDIGYHHLMNWGTNSVFVVIGKKKNVPHYSPAGKVRMSREMEISITIDERLADGYYYARTIKLMKKLIENPELLEAPLRTNVKY